MGIEPFECRHPSIHPVTFGQSTIEPITKTNTYTNENTNTKQEQELHMGKAEVLTAQKQRHAGRATGACVYLASERGVGGLIEGG